MLPAVSPPARGPQDSDAPRYAVLGTWVHAVDPARALDEIGAWIRQGRRGYVAFANVHGVIEGLDEATTRQAFNEAGLTVPDGVPLVWLGWLRGHAEVRRVYGPDTVLGLSEQAARHGWSCYFYGGAPGVAERLAAVLTERFPGFRVAGVHAPPFRSLTEAEDAEDVSRLNASRADVVFVGLGCPKQERWMADHRPRLTAAALLGVGAAFDFHTGRVRQAPRWMMGAGLEWLFRLIQEPRRLWRRYLVYNPRFVFHVILQLLRLRRYPTDPPTA
jgi:N-acetylglucosaminyldiphosphoundecaprenol N-acetyl-beta-D-mannosaminyltransferase